MVEEDGSGSFGWQPSGAPPLNLDSSVNAVFSGSVATAILISMFLLMAVFERFLRPTSSHADLESQSHNFHPKLTYHSPNMTVYAKGVSVLMPGDDMPTYIAHPAPMPCPPERTTRPQHQNNLLPVSNSSSGSSSMQENNDQRLQLATSC